jgi:hypothetical protein
VGSHGLVGVDGADIGAQVLPDVRDISVLILILIWALVD